MKLETFADLAAQKPRPEFLVEGVLPAGMLTMIYGASGCGKTFLALGMAHAIATGQSWLGRATRAGRALYVAAEGVAGLPGRVQAWYRARGAPDMGAMRYLRHPLALHDPAVLDELLTALDRDGFSPLDLLVIDTASANGPSGFDDNKSEHWKIIFDACALLTRRVGCAVALIHHPGHAGDRLRGSYDQIARADVIMRVVRTGEHMGRLKLEKHRDFEWDGWLNFNLRPVLGNSLADGNVLSLVPELARGQRAALATGPLAALRALAHASRPLKAGEWETASGLAHRTFYHARKQLLESEYVGQERSAYFITENGREVFLEGRDNLECHGSAARCHGSNGHSEALVPPFPPVSNRGNGTAPEGGHRAGIEQVVFGSGTAREPVATQTPMPESAR